MHQDALYRSEDGGFSWKKINEKEDIGNRPFYYSEIYVDPQNENRVYSVFTYVNVSEDGGKNFKELMPAYGVDNGIHKTTWNLDEKGVERASRNLRESLREPSGVNVKPGIYKLKMTFGDAISEQNIKVEFDPRLQIIQEAINQKYEASKAMESHQEKMAAIVKQLVESKTTATTIKEELSKDDKKKYDAEIKSSTEIIKKIDDIIAIYLGKVDERQGITRNPEVTVSQRFGTAFSYIRSRFGNQTDTEKQLVNQFLEAFKEAISKTNTFYNSYWIDYKKATDGIVISPFKEAKIFDEN